MIPSRLTAGHLLYAGAAALVLVGACVLPSDVQAQATGLPCPRPAASTCFRYPESPVRPIERMEEPEIHVEIFNTTYVYNIESQGTFIKRKACQGSFCFRGEEEVNGLTLFGDFTGVQLRYAPTSDLNLYGGVFFAVPFGGEDTLQLIRPIISLDYKLTEGVHLLAGTLQPRHPLHDAVFDDLMYFVRPIEQGFQLIANTPYYQQDLFINWQQQNTTIKNERFDIGYAGKLKFGVLRLNAQFHYDHLGGEIPFPDFRPIQARNNTAWAAGPELVFAPSTLSPSLSWWREFGLALTFLGTKDEPNSRTPDLTTQGHAHEVRGWADLAGWRLGAAHWRGQNFVTSNGDRFFGVPNITEINVSKFFPIYRSVSLELGGWVRFVEPKSVVKEYTRTPVNIAYFAVHWNIDLNLGPVFKRGS